ncbi:MAG: M23 family metallopeptidase [Bacteroidales bacterium]|nr:M23 family metallopeptidase [Bacteroidales bacterium]
MGRIAFFRKLNITYLIPRSLLSTGMVVCLILSFSVAEAQDFQLPILVPDRCSLEYIELTGIGSYGNMRKAREGIPAHYHTGIDIRRPGDNYEDEPVYPLCKGTVISVREDGPYAQVIIEHMDTLPFWTVYEHVAEVTVKAGDTVNSGLPIARFLNREELNQYGWHFDHFHFEVLKTKPVRLKPDPRTPDRYYASYNLVCYTPEDLRKYYFDPLEFLKQHLCHPHAFDAVPSGLSSEDLVPLSHEIPDRELW